MDTMAMELVPRILPVTNETEAAAVFASQATYALGTYFAPVPVDSFFCGVLAMQLISYFTYQRNDKWWTKAVVVFVGVLNFAFTAYLWYFNQYIFVQNFGKFAPLLETKKLAWGPFLDSLNSFVVQVYMSWRAYRLCNRLIIIPIAVFCLTLMSVGATLAVLIIFSRLNTELDAALVKIPELIWLSSVMSADLIITSSILYGLLKSKTGWEHTDRTIGKLIRMTIESQIPPFIIASAFVIEFVQNPSNLFGATLQNMQIKFYAMGLMYSLNARVHFQQQLQGGADQTGQVFAMSGRNGTRNPAEITVAVETDTFVQGPYGPTHKIDNKETEETGDSLSDFQGDKNIPYNSQARLTGPDTNRL